MEELLAKPSQDILCDLGQTTKIVCFSCSISSADVTTAAVFKSQITLIIIGWLSSIYLFL